MAKWNGGTSWTRYSNYFLAENRYDTTGVSLAWTGAEWPSKPTHTGPQGVTLISDRHVLLANHVALMAEWSYPVTIYFVNNNNTLFTYTINSAANIAMIGPFGSGYTDIAIGYLNSVVDPSLSFFKVLPSNFLNFVQKEPEDLLAGGTEPVPYFPVLYMDGGDDASTNKRTWCGNLARANQQALAICRRPRAGKRFNNSQGLKGGDSGNIVFIPFNNEVVVLGAWYKGGQNNKPGDVFGEASYIPPHIDQINTAMTALAGGTSYSVTQADLSAYKVF